ncbi:hypothetical protein LJR066_005179 [Acidovorax sp. LjRoot66]|uniref:hypothetical protein n=1 Tax=Acidovorax sp. LjRoot66 TaxID=3342334 RepID=UPI003ECF8CA4
MPLKIVLLGAPGTGAQALADALAAHLAATPSSTPVTLVVLADFSALDQTASMALLMGLDLPCPPDQQPAQQAADAQLRAALNAAGVAYRVVYGTGPARLASALRALGAVLGVPESDAVQANESRAVRLRAYGCEKCSDPVCEHRLFTALTRPPAPGCA